MQFSQYSRFEVYIQGMDGVYFSISRSIANGVVLIQIPAPSSAGIFVRFNIILGESGISETTGISKPISSENLNLVISKQPENS